MEAQKPSNIKLASSNENQINLNDPWVIGASALFVGFVLGSGKTQWLGKGLGKVAESLGSMALVYFSKSFQERNPQFFKGNSQSSQSRMTH